MNESQQRHGRDGAQDTQQPRQTGQTQQTRLESKSPEKAVDWFLQKREREPATSDKTIRNNRYNLKKFREWADETGFQDMRTMTATVADEYIGWVHDKDLAPMTTQNIVRTFRTLLQYGEGRFIVDGTAEYVVVDPVDEEDEVRTDYITAETATDVLDYLYKYEYTSLRHMIFHLIWRTGARRGAIHGLDVNDWHPEDRYLELRHRPKTGTTLKNKSKGERAVYVHDDRLAEALDNWVARGRANTTDEHGREPLLSTDSGRLHKTAISYNVAVATRPHYYTNVEPAECPCVQEGGENEGEDRCLGTVNENAFKCGESIGPHALRRSAVTALLNRGNAKQDIGERVDMTTDIMDKHYNQQTREESMVVRRDRMDVA